MCMILYHPAGAALPTPEILNFIIQTNPHGFGLWLGDKVYRSLNAEVILDKIYSLSENTSFVFHARIATRGKIRVSNCHPFLHNGDVFFHNGTFNLIPMKGKTDSETLFLKYLAGKKLTNLSPQILQGSRMCIVRNGVPRLYGQWWKSSSSGNYFSHWITGVDEKPTNCYWTKMEGKHAKSA